MRRIRTLLAPWLCLLVGLSGCQHPSVTAISLDHYCDHKFAFFYDPCKDHEGIPFYLPKPLLIVSKNFRNIEEAKVGLTDGAPIPGYFDDQSKYADLNSRSAFSSNEGTAGTASASTSAGDPYTVTPANVATASTRQPFSSQAPNVTPNELPLDGFAPETFYTYQIVFVPDMTQKFALKVKGGVGEIRAALNVVNGWQFTGLGPYYMKDSSTAQNTLSAGIAANLAASGVGDIIKDIAQLNPGSSASDTVKSAAKGRPFNSDSVTATIQSLESLKPHQITIPKYAEITIYEAYVTPEGMMEWKPIHHGEYEAHVARRAANQSCAGSRRSETTGPGHSHEEWYPQEWYPQEWHPQNRRHPCTRSAIRREQSESGSWLPD